jgi:sRNA-binding carbon storage regulator CsrA
MTHRFRVFVIVIGGGDVNITLDAPNHIPKVAGL